jgi:protein-disulfide isomerase
MNRCIRIFLIAGLTLASLYSGAQQPGAAAPAKTATSSTTTANSSLPSEATINDFLKKMFGWNTDLTWKVVEVKPSEAAGITEVTVVFSTPKGQQASRIYVTADQKHAFTGEIVPFGADPFVSIRQDLKAANGPGHGAQNPAITIVEFGDLECPACKVAQPNITKLVEEEPKVKLIFQSFPLVSIHKWAMTGAKYIDCLGRQNNDAVWKFISTAYEHQSEINEQNVDQMLKGYVKDAGGDPDAIAACAAKPETEKRVKESIALGEKVGVNSTPTFFIDGRRVIGFGNNLPYDVVKEMVDFDVANAGK